MILRNSAKCVHCDMEIVSKHRHDFAVHYCKVKPAQRRKWVDNVIVDVPGETTWSFAVDGGKDYLKRCGEGFFDTSSQSDTEVDRG